MFQCEHAFEAVEEAWTEFNEGRGDLHVLLEKWGKSSTEDYIMARTGLTMQVGLSDPLSLSVLACARPDL